MIEYMSILKNKIFIYLATRYMTYGLQFLLSLIIATRLGPYYLGVYGFVQLILNYFAQINFGISHSLNVLLVHNKNDEFIQNNYILNSFAIYTIVNIIIIIATTIMALLGKISFGDYNIEKYFLLIVATAILTYYNSIINTIIRFRNRVNLMSIFGTIPIILNLTIVWFFKEENLVIALTFANLFSCVIVFALGIIIKVVPKPKPTLIRIKYLKEIINKGFYLFLYNSCFYFILISIRTMISRNYTVDEFGYFTFSYTIASAVMLLLDSLNIIIFPKTIDVLSKPNKEERMVILDKLRVGYITSSHFMAYVAMCFFPILLYFMPKYQPALTSLNMILLTILINTNSYGYNTLLIANKKERILSRMSFLALLITIIVGLVLIKTFYVKYSYVAISMLIAYLVFSFIVVSEGQKLLFEGSNLRYTLLHFFPLKLMIPYFSALVIVFFNYNHLVCIPLILFITLNYKDLIHLKLIANKLMKNPNIIDIN